MTTEVQCKIALVRALLSSLSAHPALLADPGLVVEAKEVAVLLEELTTSPNSLVEAAIDKVEVEQLATSELPATLRVRVEGWGEERRRRSLEREMRVVRVVTGIIRMALQLLSEDTAIRMDIKIIGVARSALKLL